MIHIVSRPAGHMIYRAVSHALLPYAMYCDVCCIASADHRCICVLYCIVMVSCVPLSVGGDAKEEEEGPG